MSLTAGTVNTRYVLADVLVHGFSTFSLDHLQPFLRRAYAPICRPEYLFVVGPRPEGKSKKSRDAAALTTATPIRPFGPPE